MVRMVSVIALALWATTASAQTDNETFVAGFVGSTFGGQTGDEQELDFGGAAGHLWNRAVGIEVLANFAPEMALATGVPQAQVNSYMGNLIVAAPLGREGSFQPFVSGGAGALTVRLDEGELDLDDLDSPNETVWATNVGGGVMAFAEHVGFRGDVRYYRQISGELPVLSPVAAPIDDFDFWRGNVGIAIRW